MTIGLGSSFADRASILDLGDGQSILSKAELQKLHQSNKSVSTADVVQYSVRAIIYLKDLHPIFQSIPISKALNFKIQLYWNSCVSNVAKPLISSNEMTLLLRRC